jgi:hypothetical protein
LKGRGFFPHLVRMEGVGPAAVHGRAIVVV